MKLVGMMAGRWRSDIHYTYFEHEPRGGISITSAGNYIHGAQLFSACTNLHYSYNEEQLITEEVHNSNAERHKTIHDYVCVGLANSTLKQILHYSGSQKE
jgi:hypothetical protein